MAQRFGRYWLHEKIGHGGMAEVFRATVGPDPDVHSFDFALKRLHEELLEDSRQHDMFLAEAYLSKLMLHPNIIRHYESGEIDGRPYIAMEYLQGMQLASLNEALAAKGLQMPPDLATYITLQVLRAVDYVHCAKAPGGKSMAIVHRDITPSNIYISRQGEVKIGDFGVARINLLEPREDAGLIKGKARYIAPEVMVHGTVTQACDIWSLGVTLYEMLAGRRLYEGLSERQVLEHADRFEVPGSGDYGNAAVDKNLQQIVALMLHPNPGRRVNTATRCYKTLKAYERQVGFSPEPDTLVRFVMGITGRMTDLVAEPISLVCDRLTGIPSYQRTIELTQIELDRSKRHGRTFSILFIDLDDFHTINEEFGTESGDEVIRHIASVVLPDDAGLRSSDFIGRRGADRFLVVLPETPVEGGRVTAERIRSTFSGVNWRAVDDRLSHPLAVSIGVANYPHHGKTVGALMEAAEVACYHAKEQGKDRVVVAGTEFIRLKTRIGDGVATAEETARWEALVRLYREAREPYMREQRRFARVEIAVLVIIGDTRANASYCCEDLGPGGLRLKLPFEVSADDEIELGLVLPGDDTPIPVRARLAWQRKDGVAGFAFVELPPHARERISRLIEEVETRCVSHAPIGPPVPMK